MGALSAAELIALAGVFLTFLGLVVIPFGKWVAGRWRELRQEEREGRKRAEAELLEERKRNALLEVKLDYCEGELRATKWGGSE